ncbi:MAG: hypothetical protein ABL860_09470, partial [Candidatus Nitrotoga sp.]
MADKVEAREGLTEKTDLSHMLESQILKLSGMSLRAKGVLVLVLFLAYTLAAGFILGLERNTLFTDIQRL